MRTALTIAGSDSGGGAGIQADLKTFQEYGVFGTSVITVLTAQNTQGVQAIFPQTEQALADQLHAVLSDIGADAVKTGMLYSAPMIELTAELAYHYEVKNLVVDPVMYAKGGTPLLRKDAMVALKQRLLPLASLVTPNLPEACELFEIDSLRSSDEMKEAAVRIHELGPSYVLMKGGHLEEQPCIDILYDGKDWIELEAKRVPTPHTHGTGCTLSAAIAAGLARGLSMTDSVRLAKRYITAAIAAHPRIGDGIGPVGHHAFRESFPWKMR